LKEITEDTLPAFTNQPLAVLIFTSPWCTSCKKVISSFDALSRELKDKVSFGTCDVSACPSIASSFQVLSLPAVVVLKNGGEVKRFLGPVAEALMMSALKEHL